MSEPQWHDVLNLLFRQHWPVDRYEKILLADESIEFFDALEDCWFEVVVRAIESPTEVADGVELRLGDSSDGTVVEEDGYPWRDAPDSPGYWWNRDGDVYRLFPVHQINAAWDGELEKVLCVLDGTALRNAAALAGTWQRAAPR